MPMKAKDGAGSPAARVTGGRESPGMGAGNQLESSARAADPCSSPSSVL